MDADFIKSSASSGFSALRCEIERQPCKWWGIRCILLTWNSSKHERRRTGTKQTFQDFLRCLHSATVVEDIVVNVIQRIFAILSYYIYIRYWCVDMRLLFWIIVVKNSMIITKKLRFFFFDICSNNSLICFYFLVMCVGLIFIIFIIEPIAWGG